VCVRRQEEGVPEDSIELVALDVTKTASIAAAVKAVEASLESNGITPGLVGVINCAGIAIPGPCEYLPMSMYRQLFDVNYFGYVEVTQAFLPLLKASQALPDSRRSRVIFVGTGGGVMTPAPALLSAYMGSKWAGEAYIQCLRMEMQLQKLRIDGSMIAPAFIKPTNIVEAGKVFVDKLWAAAPPRARVEYEEWLIRFQNYNAAQKGDSPSFIAEAMEEAMLAGRPELGYKVRNPPVCVCAWCARVRV
jgi:NAD(P)-dependent dehydrogenase (short-subunit alcohol dehydrogenase family)